MLCWIIFPMPVKLRLNISLDKIVVMSQCTPGSPYIKTIFVNGDKLMVVVKSCLRKDLSAQIWQSIMPVCSHACCIPVTCGLYTADIQIFSRDSINAAYDGLLVSPGYQKWSMQSASKCTFKATSFAEQVMPFTLTEYSNKCSKASCSTAINPSINQGSISRTV